MRQDPPSRQLDQFNLRLPNGMRSRLADRAKANLRSMNAEIVMIITSALDQTKSAPGSVAALPEASPEA